MHYTKLSEFLSDWAYESSVTEKLISNLTDESLKQEIVPGGRSLGRLGWHITETISEMMGRTGLIVFSPDMEHYDENNSAQLIECYKNSCDSLVEKIKSDWKDATLEETDDMYGEQWKRGTTLAVLITHQAHHRGQMTVLMRQAGLHLVGIYGPVKEEWAAWGMEAHK